MAQDAIIRVGDDGRFNRKRSEFRDRITDDGTSEFPAEAGRYHLYVAWACPWAHRTLLARALYGMQDAVSVSVVHWLMDDEGAWHFKPEEGYVDDVNGAADLEAIYRRADPEWGSVGTVPVLWDKKAGTIVNNESRDILRMFSTGMRAHHTTEIDLLPGDRVEEIDAMIDANYESINNGVYKTGFARKQDAYEEAAEALFARLEELEAYMEGREFLVGDSVTEADVALFVTLLRFDPVYHFHFKCTKRRLRDHPNLWAHTKRMLALPGVRETINMKDTRRHYFASHAGLNPHRIVPLAPDVPELDL